MGAHRKASVQEEDAAVSPRSEQATIIRRRRERRVVFLKCDVDVFEGRWSRSRRAGGEAEAMGLVVIVVRVLA